ncbi:DegT/DnrJ/EryC1/StrS family aminotransferase [Limimaricola variabilis]|uniref:DegT/DnrJ/EryC1/StrS family aminotransferase n=1 Tax=Limimaricola variabilis TaxID=1492771 RepID=UPI002AC9E655|nr:DegT/DnrJ/EryC1/StrS family aminotransferase [Limimaricola variabilis]WPY95378.1 DegT/DnrJ/EryC1/StrS family aminotransferase [Limimaricola variabilis]
MIPFLDLRRQYAALAEPLEAAVLETLRGGSYVLGEAVESFEADFAARCGTRHAIAVNSGSSALHLALLTAGIGPGDEVITVPTTFVATVAVVLYVGAVPVLVDVDPETLTMDPAKFEAAITPRTKAVLPVHFHGRLADMAEIGRIAEAHGLIVIEDAAQAHGATRGALSAGGFGALGCFSFYPGKNLGAAGEGGAITTSDPALADRIRALRDWGQVERSVHLLRGYNFRMDTIQGAILGVKLRHLAAWTEGRRWVARQYDAGLSERVTRPVPASGEDHVYHVYAITHPARDALRAALAEAGVATNIHYPRPVHLQPAYADLAGGPGSFPVAEAYAARTLSLPIYPELRPEEIAQVISAVNYFVDAKAGQTDRLDRTTCPEEIAI